MAEKVWLDEPETCFECGTPLGPGRRGRKYCNDLCRTAFNNRRLKSKGPKEMNEPGYLPDENRNTRGIYKILLNNRSILYNYLQVFGNLIESRDLLGHGFNFKFFTSQITTPEGFVHRFCFEIGYVVHENDVVTIFERPEEIF